MRIVYHRHCKKRCKTVLALSCVIVIAVVVTVYTGVLLRVDQLLRNRLSVNYNAIYKKDDLQSETNSLKTPQDLDDSLNATMILIVAYHRSGSTLLGDMFNNNPSAIYFFEPLRSLEILTEALKPLHFLNLRYRFALNKDDVSNISFSTLRDIFTCRLERLDIANLYQHHFTLSHTTKEFVKCVRKTAASNVTYIMACLKPLRESCVDRGVRSIKTIRLSMREAGRMMTTLPNLKVIHLIRDPRGMLMSRAALGAFNWTTLDHESMVACSEILNDVRDSSHLHQLYPDRIMTILYEHIAEKPLEALKEIYKFSNLPMYPSSVQWLVNATMSGHEEECGYCSTKANSTVTAHRWRHYLSFRFVKTIDENCQLLYEKLGYRAIDLENNLSNMSYPSRV